VADPPDVDIVVADDAEGVAALVANRLAQAARDGGQIVLTGGSTPKLAYERAAALEPDWSDTELWWSDERCVPPEHEWSNYGMANAALLDNLERAPLPAKIHRIRGELGKDEGAALYEQELSSLDRFDLVLLGMGRDGHVASLYPEQPTLDETERRAIGAEAKLEPYVDRITLTLPMLRTAREVMFLIAGEDKADAVLRAFGGEPSRATPASLVRAVHGKTTAVLDAAAASKLVQEALTE
jgi:6-phosphogluconolactonase